MDITWDRETTGLLDETAIDYTTSPYKLKDGFKTHCIVVEEHQTGRIVAFYDGSKYELDGREYNETIEGVSYKLSDYKPIEYTHLPRKEFKNYILRVGVENVIAHNQINFDLLVGKLEDDMDYEIEDDLWCGLPVNFEDTLVISKTQNPDRFGGHSLDALSEKTGIRKVNFRPNMKADVKFKHFAADMLYYCIRDVLANTSVYRWLKAEAGNWNWKDAISLEKSVAWIVTRQEHRGFWFDKELAEANIEELDRLMEERKQRAEPVLPPKVPTQAFLKTVTPPARQFLKSGGYAEDIKKFVSKHGGKLFDETEPALRVELFGKIYDLPLARDPLITSVPATLDDSTHIKNWLVGLGWIPSEYKEKDLSVRQVKGLGKIKRTREEFEKAVEDYVEQTLSSNFCEDRCEFLEVKPNQLKAKLLKTKEGSSCKVLTNPNFTKGQEKEICPNLEEMAEKFPFARDVVEYLTYKHRRNSILGGGLEWDEEEEAEKGYLAYVRKDGRIPTPADTCGAATSRFKHKVVANIPRVTSLYGGNMRALFGVDTSEYFQIGYDFDSLEAKEEAHYCWRYDPSKEYCNSLTMEKPNDVHTLLARKISQIIQKEFARTPAKSVKYGCLPLRTKVLTPKGWKVFNELQEGDGIISFNTEKGVCEQDVILKKHYFEDKEVIRMSNKYDSFDSTGDHRWYGWKRTRSLDSVNGKNYGFFTTDEVVQENNILLSAPYSGGYSSITPEQASLVGWVLSDGYYKWSELGEGTSCSHGKRKGIRFSIAQATHKYWEELESCLKANNCVYVKNERAVENGNTIFVYEVASVWAREFLDLVVGTRLDKHDVNWVEWVCSLSYEALSAFYEAFYLADGEMKNRHRVESISQNKGNIFDAIVAAKQLLGRGRVTINSKGAESHKCFSIRTQKRKHITCQELKKENLGIQPTFCLTTNNSTFIIWQDDFIGITGNCTYGATAPKVMKIIGSDINTATQVFNGFWEAAFPLKGLKEALKRYWETTGGKKFILGIDGRKVPTRSAHAILNSLFQSAGVICAKRAMVIHDKLLRAEGLGVDFFKDNWREKQFCQQLIAYHDESQLEVSKALVKFKMFPTKEECQTFKDNQDNIWSDIKESPKGGFYVGYSRAGELAALAVQKAGDYYNLNVPLTAGYVIGHNWKMCH